MSEVEEFISFVGCEIKSPADVAGINPNTFPNSYIVGFKSNDIISYSGNDDYTIVTVNKISPIHLYLNVSIGFFRKQFFG